MRWEALRLVAALFVVAFSVVARADFILPTSQTRTIEADAQVLGPETSDIDHRDSSAPGFGLWSDAVTAAASVTPFAASGHASQTSDTFGDGLSGLGSADASATGGGGTDSSASGASGFYVTFTVLQTSTYSLTGTVSATAAAGGDGGAGIVLLDNLAALASVEIVASDSASISAAGTLLPGDYTLYAYATAQAFAGADTPVSLASSAFEFSLILTPEPGAAALFALLGSLAAIRRRGRGCSSSLRSS